MKMKEWFTEQEGKDILLSVAALTVIFAFPVPIFQFLNNPSLFFLQLPISFIAVVVGFLLHELAHKFTARKFGMVAFFKMWPSGILLGFFSILFSFKFAAPGAVVITPYRFGRWGYRIRHMTVSEEGLISVMGPAVNVFFAVLFRLIPHPAALFVSNVNAFLAFFNLLPIPPLDGFKVVKWKASVWVFMMIISALMILQII